MTPEQRMTAFKGRQTLAMGLSEIDGKLPSRTLAMKRQGLISYGSIEYSLANLITLYAKSARMKDRDLDTMSVEIEISMAEAAACTPIYFVSITDAGRRSGVNFDVESDFNIPLDVANTIYTA